MCDYSLDLVASRPAKVGDELVTTEFQNSMTRGFAAIGEPNVAVCLLPSTEIAVKNEVEYERFFRRVMAIAFLFVCMLCDCFKSRLPFGPP